MATLYELTSEYQELLLMAEDPDINPETISDTLEGLEGELEIKAEGYCKVIRQLEADMEAFETEKMHYEARAIACKKSIERMKNSLKYAMDITDKKSIDAGLFTLKVQANGGKQKLTLDVEPEALPVAYQKVKVEADTEAIRGALQKLKAGQTVPWAHLEERGTHLVIK